MMAARSYSARTAPCTSRTAGAGTIYRISTVPEPATLALMALGAGALLRRPAGAMPPVTPVSTAR